MFKLIKLNYFYSGKAVCIRANDIQQMEERYLENYEKENVKLTEIYFFQKSRPIIRVSQTIDEILEMLKHE